MDICQIIRQKTLALNISNPEVKAQVEKLAAESKGEDTFATTKEAPAAFLVKPLGLFVAGEQKRLPLIKDVVTTSLAVRSFAAQFGQIRPLNKRQHEFILRLTGKSGGGKPGITAHA